MKFNSNKHHLVFHRDNMAPKAYLIVFGLVITFILDLLISKSDQLIFVHTCTKAVNLAKFPKWFKVSC